MSEISRAIVTMRLLEATNKPYLWASGPLKSHTLYSVFYRYSGGITLLEDTQPGLFERKGSYWRARGLPRHIGPPELIRLVRVSLRRWYEDYRTGRWHRIGLLSLTHPDGVVLSERVGFDIEATNLSGRW